VFGRIKPTHRLVHFNWRASRTATEMPCLNPDIAQVNLGNILYKADRFTGEVIDKRIEIVNE
jgi:hypothetical protein